MKEAINLLPPPLIQIRLQRLYLQRVGHLLRRGILGLGLLVLMLGVNYLTLRFITRDLQPPSAVSDAATTTDADIQFHNELLTAINDRVQAAPPWTPSLRRVFVLMPASVQVTKLRLDEATSKLTLTGHFTSREDLTAYQRRLEQEPWLAKLEAPLSNFATGPQATFSFTLTRKTEQP